MKAQLIVVAVVCAFFGLIVGWILGSQQATFTSAAAPTASAPQAAAPAAKTVGENQVSALQQDMQREPGNPRTRVELGNLYFDAERYDQAAHWYEEALKLGPRDLNVSTDLGVCYYYLNQSDRALQQFDYSLGIDPTHAKTLLNQGVVKAFGKQDLEGAAAAWQKVIELAPDSQEGQNAKKMLDGLKSAHPGVGGAAPATPRGGQ